MGGGWFRFWGTRGLCWKTSRVAAEPCRTRGAVDQSIGWGNQACLGKRSRGSESRRIWERKWSGHALCPAGDQSMGGSPGRSLIHLVGGLH